MSKNIVVITGSPRKEGNSFALTRTFIEAAEAKGHTVTRFDAAFLSVDGCRACNTCYKTGKACSYQDDFNMIAEKIVEADGIVFSMPVYWYTMPGKIKNVIDKLYSLFVGGKGLGGKECALIATCEDSDPATFDGVRIPYEKSVALLNWKNVGHVLISDVLDPGDVEKTDGLRLAAELAEAF